MTPELFGKQENYYLSESNLLPVVHHNIEFPNLLKTNLYYRYIKKQELLNGSTGKIAFDDNGDRIYAEYDVVNVIENRDKTTVGKYFYAAVSFTLLQSTKSLYKYRNG